MFYVVVLLFNFVGGEWVEISPIVMRRNYSVGTAITSTTPSSLEIVMRTPFSKSYVSTTPVYYDDHLDEKTRNDDEASGFKDKNAYRNSSLLTPDVDDIEESINNEETFNKIPYNGFFSFLQLVQKNLLKLTARESKITVLKHLKDLLLNNLYTRISKLWKPRSTREARGYKDDHEMEFPSNEGALMTIGFLTFAVFLIKLVIKLVHALKYKYTNAPTTTTTTAATLILLKRKKREEEFNEETAKILTYIDQFPDSE